MILDLIIAAVLVLAFIISFKKGLIKSVWKTAALIITIVLVIALKTPTVNYLAGTELANSIYASMSETLAVELENPAEAEIDESAGIPRYIVSEMLKTVDTDDIYNSVNTTVGKTTDELARRLTMLMLKIISIVGLFILIRLLLAVLFKLLEGAAKLPVINQANALLGGVLGVVNALAAIYIVCAVLSLLPLGEEAY
ncbi:MAG: CvpA family protein, partial [Oscillospiraceae bacterium]|nr:CvpA family protein [Oscillospiraceae bacterium]